MDGDHEIKLLSLIKSFQCMVMMKTRFKLALSKVYAVYISPFTSTLY